MGPVLVARVQQIAPGGAADGRLLLDDHILRVNDNKWGIRSTDEVLEQLQGGGDEEAVGAREVKLFVQRKAYETVALIRPLPDAPPKETSTRTMPVVPVEPALETGGVELEVVKDDAVKDHGGDESGTMPAPVYGLTIKNPAEFDTTPWGGKLCIVTAIAPGSVAAECGRIVVGDVIEAVDGKESMSASAIRSQLLDVVEGGKVEIFIAHHSFRVSQQAALEAKTYEEVTC